MRSIRVRVRTRARVKVGDISTGKAVTIEQGTRFRVSARIEVRLRVQG